MSDFQRLGGQRSLLGFYYQVLGSIGVSTLQTRWLSKRSGSDFSIWAQLDAADEFSLWPEAFGQDLWLAAGKHNLLIQYKYSDNPAKNPLGLPELREIVLSFGSSLIHMQKLGLGPAAYTGCLTVTNKPPTKDASRVLHWATECRGKLQRPADKLSLLTDSTEAYASLLVKQVGQPERALAEELGTWTDQEKPQKERDQLVEAMLLVLPRLHVSPPVGITAFHEVFTKFCAKHGASAAKIREAENTLISEIWRASIDELRTLTRQDLTAAVTEHTNARELTPEGIGKNCRVAFEAWTQEQGALPQWSFSRDLTPVFEKASTNRIIVIEGGGGCGKTEMAAQIGRYFADALNGQSAGFHGFVTIKQALKLAPQWLEQEIGQWADRKEVDDPIDSLVRANPGCERVLCIEVDGIDEEEHHQDCLSLLLTSMLRRSRNDVLLVLTCRDLNAEYALQKILGGHATGTGNLPLGVARINIGDFLPHELVGAARAAFGNALQDRQFESPESNRLPVSSFSLSPSLSADQRRPISKIAWESIVHPRMFGAFAELRDDPQTLGSALDGENTALEIIARKFLHRFFVKYQHRRSYDANFVFEDHADTYRAIAKQTLDFGSRMTFEENWMLPANACPYAKQLSPRLLFKEAASGGLIVVQGRDQQWYWRHPFVAERLSMDFPHDYLNGQGGGWHG